MSFQHIAVEGPKAYIEAHGLCACPPERLMFVHTHIGAVR